MGGNRQSDGEKPKRTVKPASIANLTGGSRKGVPNKTTTAMKDALMSVYDALQAKRPDQAHGHFIGWAEDNPTEYYKLAAKLLPIQIDAKHSGSLEVVHVPTPRTGLDAA